MKENLSRKTSKTKKKSSNSQFKVNRSSKTGDFQIGFKHSKMVRLNLKELKDLDLFSLLKLTANRQRRNCPQKRQKAKTMV